MPLFVSPPFSLSPDVFVHPVRPDSNSRRAVADISLEKTMLSVTGKCGPPNATAPPERQETPRAGARRARLSDLKEEYDELQHLEKNGGLNSDGGRIFDCRGHRFDYFRAGLQIARSQGR